MPRPLLALVALVVVACAPSPTDLPTPAPARSGAPVTESAPAASARALGPDASAADPLVSAPPAAFYRPDPAALAGPPGSIIAALRIAAPEGVRAWAVLYRSTGLRGEPIAVSGMVLAPAEGVGLGGGAPAGGEGLPVIAWAHGTTGLADACAPSRNGVSGGGIGALAALVRDGFVVTASDYEGLGTPGLHPYLVGTSEGRSVLDSVRAAHALTDSGAGSRVALLGLSQGAHAVLWAAELARAYAPDLDVVGTVAASPPIDLRALERDILGVPVPSPVSTIETLLIASAWEQVYGARLEGIVAPAALDTARALRGECPWDIAVPEGPPFVVTPSSVAAWQPLLELNSPGHGPASGPILAIAARNDEQVPASTIPLGIDRLCRAGSSVALRWTDGDHVSTLSDPASAQAAFAWIRDRFAGLPATGGC